MVQDMDGVRGTVLPPRPHAPSNAAQGVVQLESGQQVVVATAAFVPHPDGRYSLPLRLTALPPVDRGSGSDAGAPLVLPVMVEEPDVHTRRVETGTVRMTKRVQAREVLVDDPLWRDEGAITRVPVQRVVDGPIPVRVEGDTMMVSLLEEVLVVDKRRRLTEARHSRTPRGETHHPQPVTLRRDAARGERLNSPKEEGAMGWQRHSSGYMTR